MNRIGDYQKLAADIVAWIREYAESNGIKSLVVGVSGGVDSAVVSTLCAMTGLPTYCCVIDIDSRDSEIERARNHRWWLSKQHDVHEIDTDMEPVLAAFIIQYGEITQHVRANTKSRIRMMELYATASLRGGIVVGTGNKVEDFGVGFCTLGGDHQVDISPIADLYKTEVRELGRHLGISQEILDAAPTDGLWADGRTDEDQIGATYEELEWAMNHAEHHTELLHDGYYKESVRRQKVWDIYHKLHQQNQHKMVPIPVYRVDSHIITR